MKSYGKRSFYVCLAVGLLFSLVSCVSDDAATNTDQEGLTSSVDDSTNTNQAGVTSFVIEHTFDPTELKTTLTPNLPPAVTGALASGAKRVRSRLAYNQTTGLFTNDLFLVDADLPFPTPASIDIVKERFSFIVARVNTVYSTSQPRPSVMLVGVLAENGSPVFGNLIGMPYVFSFGYTTSTPPEFSDIVSLSAGSTLIYTPHSPGSITFMAP